MTNLTISETNGLELSFQDLNNSQKGVDLNIIWNQELTYEFASDINQGW